MKQLTWTVEKISTSLCSKDPNPSVSEDSSEKETVNTSNQTNSALTYNLKKINLDILLLPAW